MNKKNISANIWLKFRMMCTWHICIALEKTDIGYNYKVWEYMENKTVTVAMELGMGIFSFHLCTCY